MTRTARARVVGVAISVVASQLRGRWRAITALALLVAVLTGCAAALIAGSRRSASVVDRYFASATPYAAEVFAPWVDAELLEGIDGVERADLTAYIGWSQVTAHGSNGDPINGVALEPEAFDPTIRLLEGRRPDSVAVFEAVVNEAFRRRFRLGVGEEVVVRAYAHDQEEEIAAGVYEPKGPTYTFRITGIARPASDIALDEVSTPDVATYAGADAMLVPARFYEEHRSDFLDFGAAYDVVLAGGAEARARVVERVEALRPEGEEPVFVGPPPFADRRAAISTPTGLETNALLALGVGVAMVGGIVVAFALRIDQRGRDAESSTLRTLGVTRAQLGAVATMRALPLAVVGAVVGVVGAYVASDRFPIGVGRQVEISPGRQANVTVLAGAALLVVTLVLGAAFAFAFEWARSRSAPTERAGRSGGVERLIGRAGAPVEVTTGSYLAFTSRGTARPTAAVGAVTVAVVVALGMLVAGIDRLYGVPAQHGWPWDVMIGNINFPMSQEDAEQIASHERIATATIAGYGLARVGGEDTELLAIQRGGGAPPAVVSGRLPETDDEIALGRSMLRRLGAEIGSTVALDIRGGEFDDGDVTAPARLRVTGEVLPPPTGERDPADMGVVLADTIAEMRGTTDPQLVLARLRGDATAAARALDDELGADVITHIVPAGFANLHRIRHLPLIGVLIAGALGTVVLAQATTTTVRRRRNELAVLRALGMTVRQLHGVLASHGLVLAVVILGAGLPLGVVVGTPLWRRIANDVGAVDRRVISPRLALLVPAVALVAVAVGAYSVRRGRHRSPAAQLRAP